MRSFNIDNGDEKVSRLRVYDRATSLLLLLVVELAEQSTFSDRFIVTEGLVPNDDRHLAVELASFSYY